MYQGIYGEWYDDNGNLAADPSSVQPAAASGTYVGRDGNIYDDAGNNLGPSGQAPVSTAPTHGGTIDPGTGDATVGQPTAMSPPPPVASGSGQLASPGSNPGFWPQYNIPAPYQFTPYGDFKEFSWDKYTPLTADQAAAEPGYAFAKQQGRDAIQTSQAAKGNVLSGAALKDLFAWGDQFAGQNYQNAENRNENVYTMNRGNAYNNWAANETGKYKQWEGNQQYGLPAWQANNQPGQFDANLRTQQQNFTLSDLLNRFKTTADSLSTIASAGAR